VRVQIIDDEGWEPDEDFYLELYDPTNNSKTRIKGEDTRTTVTIIDDDKPGIISFAAKTSLKVIASEEYAMVKVIRQNGSDGVVNVQYQTEEIDGSQNTASPGTDFEHTSGTLNFNHNENENMIKVKILPRPSQEVREEAFRIRLFNPHIVKLSKKDTIIVEIVTDEQSKKKADALQQLLNRINAEEERTFAKQFCDACMLHPTKDEDGKIEDVSGMDAFLHFATIGWKVLFAFIPPPHIWGGWAAFIVGISMIGLITMVVGEFANIFGCVLGLKTGVTAITFVAIGTSLPDTFASMKAATDEKYADSAVGNVTGSNSVNVFLGLGLPWVIGAIYY
jgi:solute carrier family 8 (sodium/calcium exchanger)